MSEIIRKYHLTILLTGMLVCGFTSYLLGKELCWDLANYHYYNPYAFLHQRWLQDYWPVSFVHANLAPGVDFLGYFLINHLPSALTVFILGAIHGINFWLIFKIARFYLENASRHSSRNATILAFILAGAGMFSTMVLAGLGSFQNDLLISLFTLGAFYLLCLVLQTYSASHVLQTLVVFASGFLLGFGAGLKLTAVTFIIGGAGALTFLPLQIRVKMKLFTIWFVAVTAGMLVSNGYWMLNLWERFHNPFYPFLNSIFHVRNNVQNQMMGQFQPQGILESLFFAFYPSRDGSMQFREYHFAIVYVLFVLTALSWAVKKLFRKENSPANLTLVWLYGFYIFSYLVWEYYFSLTRYIVVLTMLSPLLIYLLLTRLPLLARWQEGLFIVIILSLLFTIAPLQLIRTTAYSGSYFNVRLPAFVGQTPQAMVLMSYPEYAAWRDPRPQTYLIPFFPKNWRFVGIPMSKEKTSFFQPQELQKIRTLISANKAKFYLLTSDDSITTLFKTTRQLGLKSSGGCDKIYSDRQQVSRQDVLICPLTKL